MNRNQKVPPLKMAAELNHDKVLQARLSKEIIRSINFAAIKHKHMRREDEQQTPYINHLIDTSYILINEGGISDLSVLQASLLHVTIEETDTSYFELLAEFGEDIANIVKELTIDKNTPQAERRHQLLLRASNISERAKLVLLAKQLNILRELRRATPVGWSKEKVQEYFEWAFNLVAGLRKTNAALEASLDSLFSERGFGAV